MNHAKEIATYIRNTIGVAYDVKRGRPKGRRDSDTGVFVWVSSGEQPLDFYGSNTPNQTSVWSDQLTIRVVGEHTDPTGAEDVAEQIRSNLHLADVGSYNAVKVLGSPIELEPDGDGRPRHHLKVFVSIED